MEFVRKQEAEDEEAIKEKTVDTIDDKFKNFFKNVQNHKNENGEGSSAAAALSSLNLGGKGTTIN